MTRLALLIALFGSLSACGGKDASPTSPSTTSPSPTAFSLNGTVNGYWNVMPGASVTIMDGIHAGETRTTDAVGKYSFTDLTPSVFTLQAMPATPTDELVYLTQNQAVDLTRTNQSVNFYLSDH
jgi:hypothetical protein